MEASVNDANTEEPETGTFPSNSHGLSQVQQVVQNLPPKNDNISPLEPVTQTATVSTVVTTVNPSITGVPVGNELSNTISGSTLHTTVVTTVGSTSVASVANAGTAVSIAATAQKGQASDSRITPSTSAIQDAMLQTTEEPIFSSSSKTLPKTNISKQATYQKDKNNLDEENRTLRETVEDIRRKRDKFRFLTGKMEKEIEQHLQLISKYRSFLVSTFESKPIYAFQHIIERMRTCKPDSKYVEMSNFSDTQEKQHRMPSVSENLKSVARASATVSTFRAEASSPPPVNTKYFESDLPEKSISSIPKLDRPSTKDDVQFQKSFNRKEKDKSLTGHEESLPSSGGKGRSNLWTPEEDALFMKAFNQYGTKWKHIQKVLPNKSRQQIQSHGAYLLRLGKLNKELIRGSNKQFKTWHDKPQRNDDSKRFINTYESNDG